MHFWAAHYWEAGEFGVNRDSISIQSVTTKKGPLCMACICDGGCVQEGEVVSGYVVEELTKWFYKEAIPMLQINLFSRRVGKSIKRIIYTIERKLKEFSAENQVPMNYTLSVLLLTCKQYYVFHTGDNRVYKLGNQMRELTGYRRGVYKKNEAFLICSDGFYVRTPREVLEELFKNRAGLQKTGVEKRLYEVGGRNRQRGEKGAISAVYVRRER